MRVGLTTKVMMVVAVVLTVLSPVRTYAQEPARQPSVTQEDPVDAPEFRLSVDKETAAEIDELIPMLGVASYQTRERATARLIEIGVVAFAKLREAYQQSDDLEVRLRIERIVRTVYIDYHVYAQKGFLGVAVQPYWPVGEDDPPLPAGRPAVRLVRVIGGTAADRGDLQVEDVVIAIDGEPLRGAGLEVVDDFSGRIAEHPPGGRLAFTIYRGQELRHVEITLGRCPPEIARQGSVRAINEGLQAVGERFRSWWPKYFHPDSVESPE
jgi:hypothetical protein